MVTCSLAARLAMQPSCIRMGAVALMREWNGTKRDSILVGKIKNHTAIFYLVGLKETVLKMSPKTPAAVTPAPAP